MWYAPSFLLEARAPHIRRRDVEGAAGAFVLENVLSAEEAARLVAMAELMGFEEGEGAGAGRTSAAVSWCFHDELAEQLIRRIASHLPWAVAIHSPDSPAPREDRLPSIRGSPPWVRRAGGVPEGLYTLDGLNCRMRVYRYRSDSADRFRPHYDEVWPGSRLTFGADAEPTLEQDSWRYSSAATAGDAGDRWAWSAGDRVSQLTVLLYLNDDFQGGETVLYPGRHAGEEPTAGSASIAIQPVTGSILCFGQSFRFNRDRVEHGDDALLHEGMPVEPGPATKANKYVLRTDVCYAMPHHR